MDTMDLATDRQICVKPVRHGSRELGRLAAAGPICRKECWEMIKSDPGPSKSLSGCRRAAYGQVVADTNSVSGVYRIM